MNRYALLPALAADLVKQLSGHPPGPALVDAAHPFTPISPDDWNRLIALLASTGDVVRKALPASGLSPTVVRRYLAAEPELRVQFQEARLHWRKYRGWGFLEVEEIMDELARGDRTLQSVCFARGMNRAQYLRLHRLIARAPEVEQRYHLAKKTQFARTGARSFDELGDVSSKKEARAICRRMELLRRRMPKKIRETFCRERSPIERARRAAGMRLNGKPKEKTS